MHPGGATGAPGLAAWPPIGGGGQGLSGEAAGGAPVQKEEVPHWK